MLFIILIQAGLAYWLVHHLVTNDRGPKEPAAAVVIAGVFGVLAVIASLFLETWFIPAKNLPDPTHPHLAVTAATLLVSCITVGVIEEGTKALPLFKFIYRKGYFNELTDGIIYFGTAGMVFGLLEDIGYTLAFGSGTGLTRIITGPFIHAGFTSIIGWVIIRHKLLHKPAWTIWLGLATAIGLHALYDFGLFYGRAWSVLCSMAITIGVNAAIFVLYKQAAEGDAAMGLSTVGPNKFCRQCGYPNPKQFLFCTQCGHRA